MSGTPTLIKDPYVKTHFKTDQELQDFIKCCDPVTGYLHFMDNFFMIQHPTRGSMVYHPWAYQKRLIETYHNYRFSISLMPRQSGKCFGINTIVKLKNIRTEMVEEITIGKFYERFSSLPNLFGKNEGIAFPFIPKTPDDSYPIQRTVSELPNPVSKFIRGSGEESVGVRKSCISAWRKIISVLEKIYPWRYLRKYSSESRTVPHAESITHDNLSILDESYQQRRRISKATVNREANYLLIAEMYRKIWRDRRSSKMARTTTKMVEEFQKTKLFTNFARIIPFNNETIRFRSSILCNIGSFGYEAVSKQRISAGASFRENSIAGFHRCYEEENNRVRWNLLARTAEGDPTTRARERISNNSKWISVAKSAGRKLQKESTSNSTRMFDLSESVDRKFIESYKINDYEIDTDTGWKPITHLHRTVPYKVWEIETDSGLSLQCADTHILFDHNMQQIFAKDLNVGSKINTVNGIENIKRVVESSAKEENMFDLTVNDDNHRFYANGILSHNSTSAAGYLLWYAMFVPDSTVLIAAHKYTGAQEIMQRIRYAYEACPDHIKAGVTTYNKGSIDFENGSRIVSATTTANTGRGMAISLLYMDEFAFVPPNIAEEFWTSITPTLSTGGKAIITSTPNSDEDQFALIWKGANKTEDEYGNQTELGVNGFKAYRAHWNEQPGRDEKWAAEMKAQLGEDRFKREIGCFEQNTRMKIRDKSGNITEITMKELEKVLSEDK